METLCFCPPDSFTPSSPIWVRYPFGRLIIKSSICAALAACLTCSSVAFVPIRIFSRSVSSIRNTSWNTKAVRSERFSAFNSFTGTPPILIVPLSASQYLPISCAAVVFPAPDGPTKALTLPAFRCRSISDNTSSPSFV